jgi:hypothetical protein
MVHKNVVLAKTSQTGLVRPNKSKRNKKKQNKYSYSSRIIHIKTLPQSRDVQQFSKTADNFVLEIGVAKPSFSRIPNPQPPPCRLTTKLINNYGMQEKRKRTPPHHREVQQRSFKALSPLQLAANNSLIHTKGSLQLRSP